MSVRKPRRNRSGKPKIRYKVGYIRPTPPGQRPREVLIYDGFNARLARVDYDRLIDRLDYAGGFSHLVFFRELHP